MPLSCLVSLLCFIYEIAELMLLNEAYNYIYIALGIKVDCLVGALGYHASQSLCINSNIDLID